MQKGVEEILPLLPLSSTLSHVEITNGFGGGSMGAEVGVNHAVSKRWSGSI